jgi:allophanate hydrolase subunit 2
VIVEPTTSAFSLGSIQCISGTPIQLFNSGLRGGGYGGIAGVGGVGVGGWY